MEVNFSRGFVHALYPQQEKPHHFVCTELTPHSCGLSFLYWDSGRCHSQPVELSHSWATSFPAWKSQTSQFLQSFSAWQSFGICDPCYCPLLALIFLLEIIPLSRNLCPFVVQFPWCWRAPPSRASLVTLETLGPCLPSLNQVLMHARTF